MLHSDSYQSEDDGVLRHINAISIDTVAEIEKELEPSDIISLVFILYDIPDTALQRLIVYQRICKDEESNGSNLLYDWAVHAQSQQVTTWRHTFLEALATCQLFGIVRKLGFNVPAIKKYFFPENVHYNIYINPYKKLFYKICENMNTETFQKLKKSFSKFLNNSIDYEYAELLLLELLSRKFLYLREGNQQEKESGVAAFTKVIEIYPILNKFANDLKELERKLNSKGNIETIKTKDNTKEKLADPTNNDEEDSDSDSFFSSHSDLFDMICEIKECDIKNLKSDTSKLDDIYPIKNRSRPGVCYIINQEEFFPSLESRNDNRSEIILDNRKGSHKDKEILQKTFGSLNFEIITDDNLTASEMCDSLKHVVSNVVKPSDSMFILCILSHGVRGHVFGVDSIKVSVDDIQNILDSKNAKYIHEIPKFLIIQACQVESTQSLASKMVADSPMDFHVRKSDFFIYWATASEFEAYRYKEEGSIFIHILCKIIKVYSKHEHLADMCTIVNKIINKFSRKLKLNQVSEFKSRLTRKLYLQ